MLVHGLEEGDLVGDIAETTSRPPMSRSLRAHATSLPVN